MQPSSILSYYPTYAILDEVLSYGGGSYEALNVFVDLKNALQSLYMEDTVKSIVESTLRAKTTDTSIFSSIISFLSFHKLFSIKRNIKLSVYFFFETGKSYYHLNLCPDYKSSRRIDDLFGLDSEKREVFFDVFHKNLEMIEAVGNKLPNTKVLHLRNLEADFVPYYLVRNGIVQTGPNVANIVYSNDHDMLQCALEDNVYVYLKSGRTKRLVKKGEVLSTFLRSRTSVSDELFPLAMSIVGDSGDNIKGVSGIGAKRLEQLLPEIAAAVVCADSLYSKIEAAEPIFNSNLLSSENKYMRSVVESELTQGLVSRNMKLISFELLSRALDSPSSTEMLNRKNYIKQICESSEVAPASSLKKALSLAKVYLEEDSLDIIYFGVKENA